MYERHDALWRRALPLIPLSILLIACSGRASGAPTPAASPRPSPSPTPTGVLHPTATVTPKVGYDVSYPQCGAIATLPEKAGFVIVGLNGTLANNFNPCFGQEMAWARQATAGKVGKVAIYVNIANPGNTVADWPHTGNTPYGECNGGDTTACAYEYGRERAEADYNVLAESHSASGSITIIQDVEPNRSWETDTSHNVADMEGMTAAFEAHGDKVGIYSSPDAWQSIAGSVPQGSNLDGLPLWVYGATDIPGAETNCQETPFIANSKIIYAQAAGTTLDQDVRCAA